MICLTMLALSAGVCAAQPPPVISIHGRDILAPDGKPLRFRGFNVLWWVPPTPDQADAIKALGVNCVRYMFGYQPTGKFDPAKISFIPAQVRPFLDRGIWVIPVIHDFRRDGKGPWDAPELRQEFLDMWDWVMAQLAGEPLVAAWEPINEPHDVDDPALRAWYIDVVAHFRKLDPRRPIVVEGTGYSWPWNLTDAMKLDDPNIIYSFHTYGPFEYTHQKDGANIPYPGKWSRDILAAALTPAIKFRDKYNVPVWCGEWGVKTGNPGYEIWLRDVSSILEENNLPWTHWAWAQKPDNPLDPTFDCNPQKTGIYDAMAAIFKDSLAR